MSHNSFGKLLKVTTWGESHGKAIGCVVDGVPPLLELSEDDIQPFLEKRKPGQSKFTTQRKEDDKVEILSGVFEGKTTGTPISLMIWNKDQRSKDYGEIANQYRPGHADYTYDKKYGIRDYKGGGRSSARETAMRVAAGAIARKIIAKHDIKVRAALTQMGEIEINRSNWDWNEVEQNPFFSPDKNSVTNFENYLNKIRKDGSSVGAIIEVVAENVPVGLGEPIYGKLDSDLASAMMSINAVSLAEERPPPL
jgi:chorismate synthase